MKIGIGYENRMLNQIDTLKFEKERAKQERELIEEQTKLEITQIKREIELTKLKKQLEKYEEMIK